MSNIEWTERTWNPTVGCKLVSPGCANCYAKTMHHRLNRMGKRGYEQPFEKFRPLDWRFDEPRRWRKPAVIFVNSMSDLFHEQQDEERLWRIWDTMNAQECRHHTFQILTKRAYGLAETCEKMQSLMGLERLSDRPGSYGHHCTYLPHHIWVGVSVENRKHGLPRIAELRKVRTNGVRFLSVEPLLEDLGEVDLTGIGWVICGGESGNAARPMNPQWARNIRDQCVAADVPFFFKQWGQFGSDGIRRDKKANGAVLDGLRWIEMPERIR